MARTLKTVGIRYTRRQRQAGDAWAAAVPLGLSGPVADYLRSRTHDGGADLLRIMIGAGARVLGTEHRASETHDERRPCLLLPIRSPDELASLITYDVAVPQPRGIWRVWGRGREKPLGHHHYGESDALKQSGGSWLAGHDRSVLALAEGPETAAAIAVATGWRVLCLFAAGGLERPPRAAIEAAVHGGATRIIICADHDCPTHRDPLGRGWSAAAKCAHVMQTWGLVAEITITMPPEVGDWADILQSSEPEATRAALNASMCPPPPATPDPDAQPHSTWSMRPWRRVSEPPPWPVTPQPVEQARETLRNGIKNLVEDYTAWLGALRERQENNEHGPLPPFHSWLFSTTTGTGKTSKLKALINDAALLSADGAALVLVPDHAQADAYEAAGWWHYHGRNPDPDSPGYCPNYTEMMIAVDAGHIPQSAFCHRCPNGLKWVMSRKDTSESSRLDAENELRRMGFSGPEIAEMEPCRWQSHLRATIPEQFVVMCTQSYSDTLAVWAPNGLKGEHIDGDTVHRLVLGDEHAALSQSIQVGMPDLDMWARRAGQHITWLQSTSMLDNKDTQEQVRVLQVAIELFQTLGAELAKSLGQERKLSVSPALNEAVQMITNIADGCETASWEEIGWNRDGTMRLTPLRAAYAIAQTIEHGDGFVREGCIHVSATRPLLHRIGQRPVAFFDATPDAVTRAVVCAHGGHIIDAIAAQNIRIIRYPSRFFGLSPFRQQAPANRREGEIAKYRALRALYPRAALLVHKRVRDAIDPPDDHGKYHDPLLGHWGAAHRAHDRWTGNDLVLAGSFFPPPETWRGSYQSDRLAALSAGAEAADWPAWNDSMEMERGAWIVEGDHKVQSRLPLPSNLPIRQWLLAKITAETVQAIGRTRGANLNAPVTVRIFGGVPLAGLGDYGLAVSDYQTDPVELGQTRADQALGARQSIAGAINVGQTTIRQIGDWVAARTGRRPGVDRVRSVIRELEAIARREHVPIERVCAAVAARADAWLAECDGDLARASAAAGQANDDAACALLDLARETEIGDDPTAPITRTGPPTMAIA